MNKRILLALCLIAASLQGILAVEYVVNTNPDANINGSSKTFNLTCPGETLTFDLYLQAWATGSVTVKEYDINNTETIILNAAKADGEFAGAVTKSYSATVSKQCLIVKIEAKGTLSKKLQNVKITKRISVTPSSNNISCGNVEVRSSSTDTKFSIAWSNVKPLTLSLDNTTDFALSTTSIASSTCAYGTESDIIIDFHPQTKGDKTATVTISNADNNWGTVTITGHGDGLPQTISWWDEDVTMLSRGDTIGSDESPFVQASSGLALTTLTSSDENVLKIEGGKLIAVAAGTADIIAYQAGSPTVDEVRDTVAFGSNYFIDSKNYMDATAFISFRCSTDRIDRCCFKWVCR